MKTFHMVVTFVTCDSKALVMQRSIIYQLIVYQDHFPVSSAARNLLKVVRKVIVKALKGKLTFYAVLASS